MRNLFLVFVVVILTWTFPAKSAEVGDIYYHDKTFSNKVNPDKVPIGVVFWVSPDNNFGLVVSLEQIPNPLNITDANAYCTNFSTLGTSPGSWVLPRIDDLLKLGNSYNRQTKSIINNLTKINNVLKTIDIASQIKETRYIAYSNTGYSYKVNLTTGNLASTNSNEKLEVRCITGF